MSFKLYSPSSNPKAAKILVAAALVNKQIELVDTPYD